MRKKIYKWQYGGTAQYGGYQMTPQTPALPPNKFNSMPDLVNGIYGNSSMVKAGAASGNMFANKLSFDATSANTKRIVTNVPSPAVAKASTAELAASKSGGNDFGTGGMSAGMSQGLGAAGGALAGVYDAVPSMDKDLNENDATTAGIRSSMNKALLSGAAGPWGMLAGAVNMAIDKTGGFTDASKGLGKGADTMNSIASLAVPGAGWFVKKTDSYKVSDELKQSTGYTGTAETGKTAQGNASAKLLFGRKKANRMIGEQKQKDEQVQDIIGESKNAFQNQASSQDMLNRRNALAMSGGYQQKGMYAGKSGLKFPTKEEIERAKATVAKGTQVFREGGKMNVIPDGALHAHKNHIELDGITAKGIPVVTKEEGGVVQHAEVERNEIIFTKEVTEKLEKLAKDGSDEAAIEAGKILAREIIENTQDNTGLISEVNI